MQTEKIVSILILIHALFGGFALIAGSVALISKKGGSTHKKSGRVFFYSMLFSAFVSTVVALLPNHKNPFLFSIGIFSSYFLLSGILSLEYRNPKISLRRPKALAVTIIITSLIMVLFPIIYLGVLNIVLVVFGILGLTFGVLDLRLFTNPSRLSESWLTSHLGKMTGGYISAVSAFFVVNQILPGIWNWFIPGIVGGVFITYWTNKINKKKNSS
ncbi:MAG: DUF2306 domain-containing protein [Salibacteraceae bacterium]